MKESALERVLNKKKITGNANPIMAKMMRGEDKELREIPLSFLKENPYQPRIDINEDKVKDLANSIKEKGLLQPILISEIDKRDYYIVAGHRRVAAHKFLGRKTIKARVIKTDNEKLASISIIENLQRENLNLIEIAITLKKYKEEFDKTLEEIGKEIGKTKGYISQILSVLNLPDEIIKDIKENKSTKDILALNMLNSYIKKKFNMLNKFSNNHNNGTNKEKEKMKNEILGLYQGFLSNGREWLKKEINNKLKNNKQYKTGIKVNFGKRKTKIELNLELNNEEIEIIKKFLKEFSNKKETDIDIKGIK